MNLLLLKSSEQLDAHRYRIDGERVGHIRTVLKRAVGESLQVGIINGPKGNAVIRSLDDNYADLDFVPSDAPAAPPLTVDLLCAIPRPKILKRVLFASGMLGVRRLMLVRANRTDKSYLQTELRQQTNYRPYMLAGMAQGEWTRLPLVSFHDLFRPFVEDELPAFLGGGAPLRLVADPDAVTPITAIAAKGSPRAAIAIGPERGWVPFELALLQAQGFQPVSLGPWNLRVDFAVTAAIAQVQIVTASP